MRASRIFRSCFSTALFAVCLSISAPSHAIDTQAIESAGYTVGGALERPEYLPEKPGALVSTLDRISITDASGYGFSVTPVNNLYSPRNSATSLSLSDPAVNSFTRRDDTSPAANTLGVAIGGNGWQLGAGFKQFTGSDYTDPGNNQIESYMLGGRYEARPGIGFGASVEFRDYEESTDPDYRDEKIFTFGTIVKF